jgi:hypothetical protein
MPPNGTLQVGHIKLQIDRSKGEAYLRSLVDSHDVVMELSAQRHPIIQYQFRGQRIVSKPMPR